MTIYMVLWFYNFLIPNSHVHTSRKTTTKHRVVKNHETSDSESGEELVLESSYSVLPKCKWLPWCHSRGHKL